MASAICNPFPATSPKFSKSVNFHFVDFLIHVMMVLSLSVDLTANISGLVLCQPCYLQGYAHGTVKVVLLPSIFKVTGSCSLPVSVMSG